MVERGLDVYTKKRTQEPLKKETSSLFKPDWLCVKSYSFKSELAPQSPSSSTLRLRSLTCTIRLTIIALFHPFKLTLNAYHRPWFHFRDITLKRGFF